MFIHLNSVTAVTVLLHDAVADSKQINYITSQNSPNSITQTICTYLLHRQNYTVNPQNSGDLETGVRGYSRSLKVAPLDRSHHTRTKHHVDRQSTCEVMAILYIQDGRQLPSWILSNRK